MQTLSVALQAELDKGQNEPRVLIDCYEFYSSDYTPGVDGFDPADALETFAAEELTHGGIAYRREVVSRGDISKAVGEKTNSCSLSFSNVSRYMATWAQTTAIEGMLCVIRCISPAVTDDSIVLFAGRADKPSDIDHRTFTISIRQDFGNINQTLPPRKFTAEDPEGRLPGDPLYEGIQFHAVAGSNVFPEVVPSTSFFGRLFGRRDTVYNTEQWSSVDGTPYGNVLPEIFGRCQMALIPFIFADKGLFVTYLMAVCNGPIAAVTNIKSRTEGFSDPFNLPGPIPAVVHLGDLGGTGTNTGNTNQADLGGGQVFSHLAYIEGASTGSEPDAVDSPPVVTALVKGRILPLPDGTGAYVIEGWTDNPVHIARFILTDPAWVNIDPGFMQDDVNYLTSLHCDEPIIDESNDQLIPIPNPDLPAAGTLFTRYRSTGIFSPRHIRFNEFGEPDVVPEFEDGPYVGINPAETVIHATQRLLIKRYTFNSPITGEVRAVDFLYKTVFPAFRGYLRVNKYGRYEIRSEMPSDATRLRSATSAGAVSIPVLDVTPWKTGPELLKGRLLLGNTLITSEVRDVSSADFSTSGNSISLTAAKTGAVTVSASGATLSGGSTTVQASGTVTIGGTPGAGDTVTVTIDGIEIVYVLTVDDTVNTVAAMLRYLINATPRLRPYIKASWDSGSPTILTIKCLHGALNVSSAFLKAHGGPVVDPLVAPTVAASAGGSLPAGTYKVAYANGNSLGLTALTALASIVVTVNQKIDVSGLPALPAGITSRQFYLSEQANSTNIRYSVTRTDAVDFSISIVPDPGAALPPSYNTTAEELIRVAMSFATNSQDIYPVWSASTLLILSDIYLPTTPNGHKYQVSTAGTTGATEPVWPATAGGTVASGSVTFTEIGSTVLQQAGLTRANIVKDSFKWPLGSRQSSVNQVKGSYRDAKNDFALTPVRVNDRTHQAQVKKIYPLEFDASGIDGFHQFNRIANGLLSKNREGDWFDSLGTGPQGLVLEEGDVICASDDSGGLINVATRIEDLRIKPNHEVVINQARKYSTLMFSDDVGSHIIPIASTLRFTETVMTHVAFIDNFPIRDADGLSPAFYAVMSRDLDDTGDWRGATLYADYGDGYLPIASTDIAGLIGTATTTLPTVNDPSVWDRNPAHALTFELIYGASEGQFTSVSEADLLANSRRNLFLVGTEYVQAANITDNGNRSYTIDTFLRGRFGTDGIELTHGADERVVYLDGSEVLVPINATRLNGEFPYKAVTVNQDVADAEVELFTWRGGSIRPLAPINLRGTRSPAGDLFIEWTRRSRLGPGIRDSSGVPIAEEKEVYLVEIYDGSTLKNSWMITGGEQPPEPIRWDIEQGSPTIEADGTVIHTAAEPFAVVHSEQILRGDARIEYSLLDRLGLVYPHPTYLLLAGIPDGVGTWNFGWNWYNPVNDYQARTNTTSGSVVVAADADDRFAIEIRNKAVTYYKNGALIATDIAKMEFETYRVRSFVGTLTHDNAIAKPTIQRLITGALYTSTAQVADFGSTQSSIKVRVYQMSALIGKGAYAEAIL